MYEYGEENHQVDSPFATITPFISKTAIRDVDLNTEFDWKSRRVPLPVNQGEEKLLKMPTLHMRKFASRMQIGGRDTHLEIQVEHEPAHNEFKTGQMVYYGYPVEHSGRVQAYITSKHFHAINDFKIEDYKWLLGEVKVRDTHDIRSRPGELFQYIKEQLAHKVKSTIFNYLDISATKVFLFLTETQSFCRTIQGEFLPLFKDNYHQDSTIVPGSIASSQKAYQTTQTLIHFQSL